MIERDSIDNLCPPHKTFLNSQNLTGCVLCERNKEIVDLKAQLAASQKREKMLKMGLEIYANAKDWYSRTDFAEDGSILGETWEFYGRGPQVAEEIIKQAEEVK